MKHILTAGLRFILLICLTSCATQAQSTVSLQQLGFCAGQSKWQQLSGRCETQTWKFHPSPNTCEAVTIYPLFYSWASENVVLCWGEDRQHPGQASAQPIVQQATYNNALAGYLTFVSAVLGIVLPITLK